MARRNFRAEKLATPQEFAADPELVWHGSNWRLSRVQPALPNPTHPWTTAGLSHCTAGLLVTQSVDGLHRLAGTTDVKIQGNLRTVGCTACGAEEEDRRVELAVSPLCELCGEVVWLGEALPVEAPGRAVADAETADLVPAVRTSAVVHPMADFLPWPGAAPWWRSMPNPLP